MIRRFLYIILVVCFLPACNSAVRQAAAQNTPDIRVGAARIELYLPLLQGKRIAVVANHASYIGNTHLVDSLLTLGVDIKKVFAPEHGFRGNAEAGAHIDNGKDPKTGLPLLSLYGKNKKPSAEMLEDVDLIIFDLQDVGARFYTYISTLYYIMQSAIELEKSLMVLDRPNPNGFYIDGPLLDMEFSSFVGMFPIPVVHGMTVGELAMMIDGEKWHGREGACNLKIISCEHYMHSNLYKLPIPPSPNLPNMQAIYLYPSLCWFEGTAMSIGRGTDFPFQVLGHPLLTNENFEFTPLSKPGFSLHPKHENNICRGWDLRPMADSLTANPQLHLELLIKCYGALKDQVSFFNQSDFFDKLAGNSDLRKAIENGQNAEQIRKAWQTDIRAFKSKRKQYLLYADFE